MTRYMTNLEHFDMIDVDDHVKLTPGKLLLLTNELEKTSVVARVVQQVERYRVELEYLDVDFGSAV